MGRSSSFLSAMGRDLDHSSKCEAQVRAISPRRIQGYILNKISILAGWGEFRDHSLPCVGLLETTNGFVPFTGRRNQLHLRPRAATLGRHFDVVADVIDNHQQEQCLSVDINQADSQQIRRRQSNQDNNSEGIDNPDDLERQRHYNCSLRSSNSSSVQDRDRATLPPVLQLLWQQQPNCNTTRDYPRRPVPGLPSELAGKPLSHSLSLEPQPPAMTGRSQDSHSRFTASTPSSSLFTITPRDASSLVRSLRKDNESRHCYFIHLRLQPLFGEDVIPGACLRKLPRIINGIPLGPGFLSRGEISEIKWRLVEGGHSVLTFISSPLLKHEAEECKTSLKERLIKHGQAVFGDLTVKVGVALSKCLEFDDDFILNDVAVEFDEGLQFRD